MIGFFASVISLVAWFFSCVILFKTSCLFVFISLLAFVFASLMLVIACGFVRAYFIVSVFFSLVYRFKALRFVLCDLVVSVISGVIQKDLIAR